MSAAVHLHRQEQGQEARLHGQAAVLSEGLRHRHLGLHELPDLRRGLPVRRDQDGHGIRAEQRDRFDHLLLRKEQLSKSNGYYHKIHPVEAETVDKNLADAAAAAEAKKKAAAEAAAKAAAAKAAAAKTTEAEPPAASPARSPASS